MDRKEFETRTSGFLPKQEIEKYEEFFEPAYMECDHIDKDEFCLALKDEHARKVVKDISAYILKTKVKFEDATYAFKEKENIIEKLSGEINVLRNGLSLISATCDRISKGNILKKGMS